jgi:integrase
MLFRSVAAVIPGLIIQAALAQPLPPPSPAPARPYLPCRRRLAEIDKLVSLHSFRHSVADRALRRRGLCSPFSL